MRAIAGPGIHQYSFVAAILLGHSFGTSEGRTAEPLMALAPRLLGA